MEQANHVNPVLGSKPSVKKPGLNPHTHKSSLKRTYSSRSGDGVFPEGVPNLEKTILQTSKDVQKIQTILEELLQESREAGEDTDD